MLATSLTSVLWVLSAAPEGGLADSSTTAAETVPVYQLDPLEYEPPRPPTAAEIEAAEGTALQEQEVDRYAGRAGSFRNDMKGLIEVRYNAEKERISGQYRGSIERIEDEERQRRLEAIARFQEFLDRYPDDPFYSPDAMFRLAELYFERSSDEYLQLTKKYGEDLQRFERGELPEEPAMPKPSFERTIELYRNLLANFPQYRHADAARYLLGYSYEESEQREEALAQFKALVEGYPSSKLLPEVWTRIGEIYFDENAEGSLERAAAAYQRVMEFKDSLYFDKALYKLAWTYYRMNQFEMAVQRFVQLVEFADEQKRLTGKTGSELRAEAVQYIAVSLADDGWGGLSRAEQILGPLKDRPYIGELWKRYGEILYDQTKYPEAVQVLSLAVQKYPTDRLNPEIQSKIVSAYERLRDFDGATRAREELVARYAEGTPWYEANRNDKLAIQTARELAEKSLYSAAIFNHQQAQSYKKSNRVADARNYYERAAKNYQNYLARFPDSKNAYDFNFFLAECLFYSDDYLGAARQYEVVRDSTVDNRHLNDAAISAVIAYEKQIEREVGTGKLADLPVVTGQRKKIEPKDVPELRKSLIGASDRFLTLLPESERAPAVAYRAAEVFYRHDQLDEARTRFEKIVIKYPGTEVARYSANLIIESYLATEDWQNVQKWSKRLREIFATGGGVKAASDAEAKERETFTKDLKNFEMGAIFKMAEQLDAAGDFEAAANTYVSLVDQQPDHQFADKALFNAAIAYEKVKRFDTASKIYQRIYDSYPSSELADRALFRVGVNFEKGFDFPGAISAYTKLVERYPNSQHRADALYNVAVTLENMQEYAQAAAAFKRYASTFPDREDASEVFFRAGLVYEKMSAWPETIKTFEAYLTNYARAKKGKVVRDRLVEAHLKIAEAYAAQKKGPAANKAYKACEAEYKKQGFSAQDRASAAAAKCTFEIVEEQFRAYDAIKITGSGKRQVEALKKKAGLQQQVEKAYNEVFKYKRVETTLAALYRMGHSYERFAESMYAADVPPELAKDPELVDEYKIQLADKAAVLERKAEQAYRRAYEESKKSLVTNVWTERILEGLNKYQPEEFPIQKAGKPAFQATAITAYGLDGLGGDPRTPPAPAEAPPAAAPAEGAPAATPAEGAPAPANPDPNAKPAAGGNP